MTQEEKNLLLRDLCGRLPYGVNVLTDIDKTFDSGCIGIVTKIEPYVDNKFPELKGQYLLYEKGCLTPLVVDEVKPYLRPMSSMTEEERAKIAVLSKFNGLTKSADFAECSSIVVDYCNSRHLDYHRLIEKGLALEAPEDMYKTE